MGDINPQKVNSENLANVYWKDLQMSVMCHMHSIYLNFFNLHKNPAKPITILHFIVAETRGKKSPKKRKYSPRCIILWFFKLPVAMNHGSFLPCFQLLMFSVISSLVVAHVERGHEPELTGVLINEWIHKQSSW